MSFSVSTVHGQLMKMRTPELDITLVSGRRPELLERTLASFDSAFFRNFNIAKVFANIDPFGGSEADHRTCAQLIRRVFPRATISEPINADFGLAVKTLWSQVQARYLLHMEDDWLALQEVTPEQVFPLLSEDNVTAVSFSTVEQDKKGRGKPRYQLRSKRIRVLGIPLYRRTFPFFCTSPSIWDGPFAKHCAQLMDPDLDPEKQFWSGQNSQLRNFSAPYRTRILYGPDDSAIMKDIGRSWRRERGIRKHVIRGKSVWSISDH